MQAILTSMTSFKQVACFKGNLLAVFMDGGSLTDDQTQAIANWTKLSETTFVVPTTTIKADYRARIFTPKSELPIAGHPTIGMCHALLEAGVIAPKNGVVIQECGAGLITLNVMRLYRLICLSHRSHLSKKSKLTHWKAL